jgi:hypothetical protein
MGRFQVRFCRMRTALLPILFLLSALASADPVAPSTEVVEVAYGTSFGECVGYCVQELHISGGDVVFLAQGWYAPDASQHKLEDVRSKQFLSRQETEELWRLVLDVKYGDIPERIGCPDCNDGGAEWLEFTTSGHKTKKIEFEWGKAPEALRALAARCKQIRQRFKTPQDWRRNL